MFAQNGRSGYVPKPSFMLDDGESRFASGKAMPAAVRVSIRVISGHYLPTPGTSSSRTSREICWQYVGASWRLTCDLQPQVMSWTHS